MVWSGAWRKLIHVEKLKSKISWHSPFNNKSRRAHLSGEVGATRHPNGDVHVVAVAVELSGGEGVAQVAVVVLRVALLRLPLVAQVPQVQ